MQIAKKGKNINTTVLKELMKKCNVKIAKQLDGVEFIFFFSNGIYEVYELLLNDAPLITKQDIFDILVKGEILDYPGCDPANVHLYTEPSRGTLWLPNGYFISIVNGALVYTDEKHPFEIALFDKEKEWVKPSVIQKIYAGNPSIDVGEYNINPYGNDDEDKNFSTAVIGYTIAENVIQLALELGNL